MELEAFSNIIRGASIDEFDKYTEDWHKLGGDRMTEEINSLYNK